jgi:hypothetical protein
LGLTATKEIDEKRRRQKAAEEYAAFLVTQSQTAQPDHVSRLVV